jgi:hypothetical protein
MTDMNDTLPPQVDALYDKIYAAIGRPKTNLDARYAAEALMQVAMGMFGLLPEFDDPKALKDFADDLARTVREGVTERRAWMREHRESARQ